VAAARHRWKDHAEFLPALIAAQPDLTLDEVVVVMEKRGIAAAPFGASSIAATSAKKTLYAAEQHRAEVARARRRWMREQCDLSRRDSHPPQQDC
jgi:hypothetical protein